MKIIKLDVQMYPLIYLIRHWGKLYYIDQSGFMLSVSETKKRLANVES